MSQSNVVQLTDSYFDTSNPVFRLLKNSTASRRYLWHEWVKYTPKLADTILTNHNSGNRKVSKRNVELIAQSIADLDSGGYLETGETIIFDKNGVLRDGSHRLHACAKAGKPIIVLTVVGIDPKGFHRIDYGKKRTVQDILGIEGYKKTQHLSNAINTAWAMLHGHLEMKKVSASEKRLEYDYVHAFENDPDYTGLLEIVYATVGKTSKLFKPCLGSEGRLSALIWWAGEEKSEAIDILADGLGKQRRRGWAKLFSTLLTSGWIDDMSNQKKYLWRVATFTVTVNGIHNGEDAPESINEFRSLVEDLRGLGSTQDEENILFALAQ